MRTTLVSLAVLLTATGSSFAQSSRFFFSGDGHLALRHAHFDESLDVQYRDESGYYDPVALEQIARLMRSREDGAVRPISLRLIELIDFVEDRACPDKLALISGYRSREFNEDLRARGGQTARASLHTEGMAVDLQPVAVDLRKLWLDLRELGVGGVGYYATEGFLHLDTGPPRFWEQATSKVGQNLAKGNARIFARTDFDRYENLDGAVISLHQVTAFPIRIGRDAHLGSGKLVMEPMSGDSRFEGGCFIISRPAPEYRFRIKNASMTRPDRESRIRLVACKPRLEATPAEIETNPISPLRNKAP